LYGSVNASEIAAALKAAGFHITTDQVRLEGPLKELGLYTVKIHLHADIDAELKVWVVPTVTSEAPAGENKEKAEAKGDKADKRKPEKAEKPKSEKAEK
jgi:large subunit ribosomal protein L9